MDLIILNDGDRNGEISIDTSDKTDFGWNSFDKRR